VLPLHYAPSLFENWKLKIKNYFMLSNIFSLSFRLFSFPLFLFLDGLFLLIPKVPHPSAYPTL